MKKDRYYTNSRERFDTAARMRAHLSGETYIEPEKQPIFRRPTRLFNWHIRVAEPDDGTPYYFAEGNVIDHPWCVNSERVVTKALRRYKMNEEFDEVLLYTDETEYHCSISECTFYREDVILAFMPEMKPHYTRKKKVLPVEPSLDDDSILMVVSDHYGFFFEGLYVKCGGRTYSVTEPDVHVGMMADSCPIKICGLPRKEGIKFNTVDMYYYPHSYYLDFYSWNDYGFPVWFENRGEYTIHCKTPYGLMEIDSGKRVRVCKENSIEEDSIPYYLNKGRLYFLSGPAD